MDCRDWEELLDDYLAGKLPPPRQRAVEEHLAACSGCRELLDTVRGNLDSLQTPAPEDLTGAILARTSGPTCPRAEERLCDLVSGALAAGEAQLVRAHLEHCRRCQALVVTLRWLLPELREMGELQPDPAFTAEVLRATAPLRRRVERRAAWRAHRRGLAAWWRRQLLRPRFALEVAYMATVLIVALFGTPISPLQGSAPRALAVVQATPGSLGQALAGAYAELSPRIGELGRDAWQVSGAHLTGALHSLEADLAARGTRAAPALQALRAEARSSGEALLDGELVQTIAHLRGAGRALERAWQDWRGRAAGAAAPAREANPRVDENSDQESRDG